MKTFYACTILFFPLTVAALQAVEENLIFLYYYTISYSNISFISLAWHSGVHPWPWICACRHQSLQPPSVLHQPQSGLFQAFHMFNRSLLPWLYGSNCRDAEGSVCRLQDYTELLLFLIGVPVICNVRNYLSYFFFHLLMRFGWRKKAKQFKPLMLLINCRD